MKPQDLVEPSSDILLRCTIYNEESRDYHFKKCTSSAYRHTETGFIHYAPAGKIPSLRNLVRAPEEDPSWHLPYVDTFRNWSDVISFLIRVRAREISIIE